MRPRERLGRARAWPRGRNGVLGAPGSQDRGRRDAAPRAFGRARIGAAIWTRRATQAWPVLEGGGDVSVAGDITVWARRTGEKSASLKGALGAAAQSAFSARERVKGGEVLVPVAGRAGGQSLEDLGLSPGGEYRVMALRDDDGARFSSERGGVATIRPACGNDRMGARWPIDVALDDVRDVEWRSRFDPRAFPARVAFELTALAGGGVAGGALLAAWVLSAVAPIPLVLLARTFASLYVIPSESMAPARANWTTRIVRRRGSRPRRLRGGAYAGRASRIFRGDESRHRRRGDADISEETSRPRRLRRSRKATCSSWPRRASAAARRRRRAR